jgi:hypothetical protein
MTFFITNDCSIKDGITAIDKPAIEFLENVVKRYNSVKKIIVTDCNFEKYQDSVRGYSIEIDTCINLTENGCAVVINGMNSDNDFEQYIYIRGDIFYSFCTYLYGQKYFNLVKENYRDEQASLYETCANTAFKVILHEIGHAVDYEKRFMAYGQLSVKKNNCFPKGLKEFAELEMMTIWSEYFAERFTYERVRNADAPLEEEVIKLLKDNNSEGIEKDLNKIYRLIYWFVLYIAYYHNKKENYFLSVENSCQNIIYLLNELSDTLKQLYDELNNRDFKLECSRLGDLFIKIYKLKYGITI